ncbi:hybrid-cluster NAD(P)-dependent oxidoreductase [Burkholderia ubonensis]|uniref:Hybrid-cluster NAD(P)-dependent oxidoreductase n=1 Tax=Burkholderia ubonensis TaxID=101571 RepID=A0AB74DB81_9BURK|nr:hybrid-cluster NAD(P)-dependent oxidoreductase [Burkholderia ubonensis]PAJ78376.1 hybrid-cluster NAD(P)-dependent oxidoreductase [Burkholderia ubonensis]PAJ84900.1 hybrid-cluster NAD(P)-dependent oxidoreductase [Burkholderia ubonensis]PAJ91812.1 hybrid-cluster NAD(P)-dependent oxidoreductase [Burkholderia ubonensis]PAJ98820.1 hybrid-cluster NAD(P)-dependent oxidoreductase [Burkholderia ubonensis]PAK04655.1 hybrid-cluster NAD(P)-dependent oxidoreductase [Burkholderia ubonensis]
MNAVQTMIDPAPEAADRLSDARTWECGGNAWPSSERRTLTCCRVTDETHDIRSFEFRTGDGLPVRFEPGQFLTVSALVNGQSVERCYTISSPPTRPYLVSITVKRVPGGIMSNWLHDNMKPGARLDAYGPSGTFTPTAAPAARALYLSAGSGVTPLMSMTRASIDLGLDREIAFVHSARTPADIVFRDELRRLAKLSPRLRLFFVCEGVGDEDNWAGGTGRLSLPMLSAWVPDYADREVFTCGPAGYMNAVRALLREGGHDPARYHQESFDFSANAVPEPAPASAEGAAGQQTYTVKLSRSSKHFTMSGSETVLAAAKKAGVAVASSCSQGVCGTCKTRLLEGTVDMRHNGGIRDREVQKGFRLLCCSRPTSDLVLEL